MSKPSPRNPKDYPQTDAGANRLMMDACRDQRLWKQEKAMPEETKPVEREAFEKWAVGPKLPLARHGSALHGGLYDEYMTHLAWLTWQASADAALERAAQVAENEPRSWDANAPDPQHRIAVKIRALKGSR